VFLRKNRLYLSQKKQIPVRILLPLYALFLCFSLAAKPVDEATARLVATNFYRMAGGGSGHLVTLALTEQASFLNGESLPQPVALYYVFDIGEQGFVMVSADDNLWPVPGYSKEGSFPKEALPPHIDKWFEQYRAEIRYVLEHEIAATDEISARWSALLAGETTGTDALLEVNPLLTTRWNQAPHYNAYCPGGAVTGCVATAMAQIMKYWNYPQQGTGYHSYNEDDYGTLSANFGATTYNWSAMPNDVLAPNNAVATLMYHCGVSVDMNYGLASSGGSGAYVISSASPVTHCSEYALKTYFGYAPTLAGAKRSNYTSSSWINLMKSELNASRPILHTGFGAGGGHAFVCDGYDNSNYFHFNWGWGGNSDGYFWIDQLNPGTLGAGGGSGGFNSNQQILIGIQPASAAPQTASIQLYSSITVSPNPIQWNQGFTVNANIINKGTTTFYGDITAALFDESGNFVDFIQTYTEGNGLPPNYFYTNGINFTTTGLEAAPGKYYIGIYVKPANDWVYVGDGSFSNYIPVSIVYGNNIELYAEITPSVNPLVQNQPANFFLDLANYSSTAFNGSFSLDVHDLDGNWIQTIQELNNYSLCASCHYINGLTFSTGALNLEPGSYLLAAWEKANGADWDLVGSTYHANPIEIAVRAPLLSPDVYESNNAQNSASNLPLSFSANTANISTNGSNNHVGTDYDYYKVFFPAGYSYTVTPRVHDSYNSGNGQTYTNDVLFSYNLNGSWSDAYDDVTNGSITVPGNKTMFFHVAPYFQGETGTYLLQIQVTRTSATAVDEQEENFSISVFPNPASDRLNIASSGARVEAIAIFDVSGRQILSGGDEQQINISGLPDGTYLINIVTDKGIVRDRFLKAAK